MKKKLILYSSILLVSAINAKAQNAPAICGPVRTLYQTAGNTTTSKTDVRKFNQFTRTFTTIGTLQGVDNSSSDNSAYNYKTQLVYSNPGGGSLSKVLYVFDPANNFAKIGEIAINGTVDFNQTLFAYDNFVGFINGNMLTMFDVTGLTFATPTTRHNLNVSTSPNKQITLTASVLGNDFSRVGNNVYGVSGTNGTITRVNINSPGTVTTKIPNLTGHSGTAPAISGAWGATWQDLNGNFYAFNNGSGEIFRVDDIENNFNNSTVNFYKVFTANASGSNDGFGCELMYDLLDWDGDGLRDSVDLDDDNDGILDINEGHNGYSPDGDDDTDGTPNYSDPNFPGFVDSNNDGVNDNFDTDKDGYPDAYDLDSDGDGCFDAIEGNDHVSLNQLNPDGSININAHGGINATGVPNLVNPGGAADNDGATGQPAGLAKNASANDCLDSDGDGVPDNIDLDDDNDGILDTNEDNCSLNEMTEGTHLFLEDFGTGGFTTNSDVIGHTYTTPTPGDGYYAVGSSSSFGGSWLQTDLTGHKDAGNPDITNGSTAGRYLAINIDSPNFIDKAIWRKNNIAVNTGKYYRFRIDVAGLCNSCSDKPNFKLVIQDATTNVELASYDTTALNLQNDDVWKRIMLNFQATSTAINILINNFQPNGSSGNDIGIDNIVLTPLLYCDKDNDGIKNSLDLDSDNDGCTDAIEGGASIDNSQLVTAGGTVTVGTGSTAANQNLCANGTCVDANGVPQLTPTPIGYNNATGQSVGSSNDASVNSCICYNPANTTGTVLDTKAGITLLKRAGSGANGENWPMVRKGGHIALESNKQGFVPTRMATADLANITNPQDGMIIYDTTAKCLKIFVKNNADAVGSWNCFSTPACP
ncbi:DUF6923 family protein [Amniculibacterium aquaticum]|uniref:DUF6923 family protein n=1 Tax=Amniculibacterium aquaticum TaxID=2479858 RepID=UPI000F59100F|nr:hypothetical protein [Amniculibacterium aquaticum]